MLGVLGFCEAVPDRLPSAPEAAKATGEGLVVCSTLLVILFLGLHRDGEEGGGKAQFRLKHLRWFWHGLDMVEDHFPRGRGFERQLPGEHAVHYDSERIKVGAPVRRAPSLGQATYSSG